VCIVNIICIFYYVHTYISETIFLESVFLLLFSCTKSCACAQMYNSHILYNVCYKKYIYHLMFIICVSVFTCTLPIFYTINIYICTKNIFCMLARMYNAHVFYIFYIYIHLHQKKSVYVLVCTMPTFSIFSIFENVFRWC